MKKIDVSKLHETFTDESNSVILIDELLDSLSHLSKTEQMELLKQVLLSSEEENKCLEQERINSENFYNNRVNTNTEKRKVISIKKVVKSQKEYINNAIKEHKEIIEKLVYLSLDDFKAYVLELDYEANDIFYLLGLIKEKKEYQDLINIAYLTNDKDSINEGNLSIIELDEKIEFLKSLKLQDDVILDEQNKCRIVFLETSSLRSYFLEDINGLDAFYDSFAKLFKSLENGEPYKMKYFNHNNKLNGLLETRDLFGQTRIFYDKLDERTYIILHAIVKKVDKSMGYKTQLESRYSYYLQKKSKILDLLNDEEYIVRQEKHLNDVISLLGLDATAVTLRKDFGGGLK